jgi:hypothetical protein
MEWRVRHCRPSVDTVSVIINVMVNVLASSVVDREFESRSGQNKDFKTDMFRFFTNCVDK